MNKPDDPWKFNPQNTSKGSRKELAPRSGLLSWMLLVLYRHLPLLPPPPPSPLPFFPSPLFLSPLPSLSFSLFPLTPSDVYVSGHNNNNNKIFNILKTISEEFKLRQLSNKKKQKGRVPFRVCIWVTLFFAHLVHPTQTTNLRFSNGNLPSSGQGGWQPESLGSNVPLHRRCYNTSPRKHWPGWERCLIISAISDE